MIKIISVVLGFFVLFIFVYVKRVAVEADKTDCDIQDGPCIKKLSEDFLVEFDILPKPVNSMTANTFIVHLKKGETPVRDAVISLDLNMPGMYMGKNRTFLVHKQDGTYEGNGVIVRCPSGRKVWKAGITIEMPRLDNPTNIAAEYIFKVAN
jgi:hypothetical protein